MLSGSCTFAAKGSSNQQEMEHDAAEGITKFYPSRVFIGVTAQKSIKSDTLMWSSSQSREVEEP